MDPGYILVVDDDDDLRESTRLVLESDGYAVEAVGTGREALACVQRKRPSLVLLDLMMPQMNGADVLHELRRDPKSHGVRVVLMTAWPNGAASLPGVVALLRKPIDADALRDVVGPLMVTPDARAG